MDRPATPAGWARGALAVAAALALFGLFALGGSARGHDDSAAGPSERIAAVRHTAAAAKHALADRGSRLLSAACAPVAAACLRPTASTTWSSVVRLHDHGGVHDDRDGWRALLLGAPPSPA